MTVWMKISEVNKAANVENHTSCVQNEWQQEKGEKGDGGASQFLQLQRRGG